MIQIHKYNHLPGGSRHSGILGKEVGIFGQVDGKKTRRWKNGVFRGVDHISSSRWSNLQSIQNLLDGIHAGSQHKGSFVITGFIMNLFETKQSRSQRSGKNN